MPKLNQVQQAQAKHLLKEMRKWVKDFEATQPGQVGFDNWGNTFDGDAYQLMQSAIVLLKEL